MVVTEINIPQLGEGLQEVLIDKLLKQTGEQVKRDEVIYVIETDKALMDVESPCEGVMQEWLVEENDIVPVGSPVARIQTNNENLVISCMDSQEAELPKMQPELQIAASALVVIPPRTRAHCKQLGISEDEMFKIPASTEKLMPQDVDKYVTAKLSLEDLPGREQVNHSYTDRSLSGKQKTLLFRLKRSSELVVPGTISRSVAWFQIQEGIQFLSNKGESPVPSEFQVLAYCVAQASKNHPKFRSVLTSENTVREYHLLNLGIALARPNDELITAVIPGADCLDLTAFTSAVRRQMRKAIKEGDQASESTQITLSYLGEHGIIDATPALVAPAIAVMFIGSSYEHAGKQVANIALTFDHRLINGAGAAHFLNDVAQQVEFFMKS
ncbi:MAG: 2-oxo acid dehydrogenase subunit E2 [Anaerolineae bacterium]|nr:2-oxo acid dehydrogenase subunit E2 [Gloeobacterales cyanobacterium ES-bin-313]